MRDMLKNLKKFAVAEDQFGDGMTIVPQELLAQAAATIERLHADRLKLDRRIHNQRKASRDTWETVERRGNYMGSKGSRETLIRHMQWGKALICQLRSHGIEPNLHFSDQSTHGPEVAKD